MLGGVRIETADGAAPLRPQAQFVLGSLLRQPARSVPVDRLTRTDTGTTESAVAAARVAVSRLRAALAPDGLDNFVITTPGGYALDVDPLDVDHVAFTQAVRRAEATEWPDEALQDVEHALSLWAGSPFGDLGTDPEFEVDALALDELHRSAVDLWGELVVNTDRHRESLPDLEAAAAEEPLRERRWASLMLAHYRSMNQTEALRAYERARVALVEGVGLEPGPELARLADDILRHDAGLGWTPALRRPYPADTRVSTSTSVVIGRGTEIDDILQLLERRRVVNLIGLGGIGKSSLAGEIAVRSRRPAWMVPLATVRTPDRIGRVVAERLGLSSHLGEPELLTAIADRLHQGGGLVVLDNCEHLVDDIPQFVHELLAQAPNGRVLTTSRVDLDIHGAVGFTVPPLPVGSPDDPGAAALIAADSAMIPPSQIRVRWETVEAICRQADGIPLALELVGAAVANGDTTAEIADTTIAGAVSVAVRSISDEARRVVDLLAVLPGTSSIPFLAEASGIDGVEASRAIGQAARAGLVVRDAAGQRSRVGLIEPARNVLTPTTADSDGLMTSVRCTVFDLAERIRPNLVERFQEEPALLVDDEHDIVMWLVPQLPADDQVELVTLLGPLWGACGRSAESQAWFAQLGDAASERDPLRSARYWIARAQASPSFATRVPLIPHLQDAIAVVEANGETDRAERGRGELSVALMWSGRIDEGRELLRSIDAGRDAANRWGALTVAKIQAVADTLSGEIPKSVSSLRAAGREFLDVGNMGDVMSCFYLAAVSARMGGDTAAMHAIFDEAGGLPQDRFSGYSHAALNFERAQLAVAEDDPNAGPLLWETLGLLTAHGEHRTAAVCRRDLGRWRLAHGDPDGAADVARAARNLMRQDSNAAAVALAVLATDVADAPERRRLLGAAARAQLSAPGGGPIAAAERSIVEQCAGDDPSPEPEALNTALRDIEDQVTHT